MPRNDAVVESKRGAILTCKRCQWEWVTRRAVLPKVCPHCKSRIWNKTKLKKGASFFEENYYGL